MEIIEKIKDFELYDRVKIKGKNITGNIVNIINDELCDIEYDDEFANGNEFVFTHNVNELEKI